AGNSPIVRNRPTGRTCLRSPARRHHPRKWSTRGPRNPETTTTTRTGVAAFADTTRKLYGAKPKKWDARWLEAQDGRFGFVTTIRRATGSASGPTKSGPPLLR